MSAPAGKPLETQSLSPYHCFLFVLLSTATFFEGFDASMTNLFGRVIEVVAPAAIGLVVPFLGISWAVSLVGFGPILGALLVLRYAPETRGLTLEQIQDELDAAPA